MNVRELIFISIVIFLGTIALCAGVPLVYDYFHLKNEFVETLREIIGPAIFTGINEFMKSLNDTLMTLYYDKILTLIISVSLLICLVLYRYREYLLK